MTPGLAESRNRYRALADTGAMARPLRHLVVLPGFPHHVILRGNNRRRLFSYESCYLTFLRLLRAASIERGVPVHSFALMANHVHLVVTPPDVASLARFVKCASQRYAVRRNRACDATGKLFEQRYVALPIADDSYLAATLAYVDLNPVRAGLVRDALDYRWSSAVLHAGRAAHPLVRAVWTPHPWYLELSPDAPRRTERYVEWLASRSPGELDAVAEIACDRDDVPGSTRRPPRRPDRTLAT